MNLEANGYVLYRNLLAVGRHLEYLEPFIANRTIDPRHPAALWMKLPITTDNLLLELASELLGTGNVGLYHERLLIKDETCRDARFLHQDAPYHRGYPKKLVFFVALTNSNRYNGGLRLYTGSHKLGSLRDVGEVANSATGL